MNRSTIKAIGLLLLVPSILIGILPLLASYTELLQSVNDFSWSLGNLEVASVEHAANGVVSADATPWVWVIAGIGEITLLMLTVARPKRPSRFVLDVF